MRNTTPITILILLTLLLSSSVTYAQGWFDTDWPYRKPITIDADQVDVNFTNFPVLIDIADADLDNKAQADGDDIFFTGADGTSKLDHEIESYSAGNLVAWVRVPSISSTADTVIYMYYGNPTAGNQENPEGVWNTSYRGVWHLHDDFLDSTTNVNDATNNGSTDAVGQIADGQDFNGTTDYIDAPNHDLGAF